MQVKGLDVYRASSPLDEPAIKHRDSINKANAGAVQKAQQALEQEQATQHQSKQKQKRQTLSIIHSVPADPKEVMPSQAEKASARL